MTLADDVVLALPGFRVEAESRMVEACTIAHPGGAATFDPNTGAYTDPAGTVFYTGPCEVQVSDGVTAQDSEAGGTELTVLRLMVKIPVAVEGVVIDDVVTVTASLLDPDLVGRVFRVTAGHAKSFLTARRLQVEEISA